LLLFVRSHYFIKWDSLSGAVEFAKYIESSTSPSTYIAT